MVDLPHGSVNISSVYATCLYCYSESFDRSLFTISMRMHNNLAVCMYMQDTSSTRLAQPTDACPDGVQRCLQSHGISQPSLYMFCHVNGHDIAASRNKRASTSLVAYQSTTGAVHFGDVLVFVRDNTQPTAFAVISRRIAKVSHDPFYICVSPVSIGCDLVIVRLERVICGCSEWPLPSVLPVSHMIIFHQLSVHLHNFE